MGSALIKGILSQHLLLANEIGVSEPNLKQAQALQDELGIQLLGSNQEAAAADTLLLAVKPQIFPQVLIGLSSPVAQFIISVMAGIDLETLESAFPDRAVVRTMPNAPALVGAGMTAYSCGQWVTPEQAQWVEQLFGAVGAVLRVPESKLNAVTALSGSGPGYLAVIVEALIDGGVQVGLSRPEATQLAVQTLVGTGTLLQQEQLHPSLLKDRVTSPEGTTITGIAVLEERGLRAALMAAIQAAQERAVELGRG